MRWKAVAAAALLLVAAAAGLGYYWTFGRPASVLKLPGVVEIQEVRLGPRISGRVADVMVREGDTVKADAPLVKLAVPELAAQRDQAQARVAEAEALLDKARNGPLPEEREAAQAALEVAQARLKRCKEGYREEEKRQAEEEWKAAQADLKLAREEIDRVERLFKQSASSKSELDSARSAVDRLRSRAQAAKARLDLYRAGSRAEDIAESEAAVKQAQASYDLLYRGTREEEKKAAQARLAEARARLAEIEANLKEATITAPEDCLIEVVAVRKGDLVQKNQPILRVLRTADLWVKIYVPETELGRVKLHRKVSLTVDGYPDRHFEGEVMQIASESEFTPRNVQSIDERKHQVFGVKIRVADSQGVFKSGMAAEVQVPLSE